MFKILEIFIHPIGKTIKLAIMDAIITPLKSMFNIIGYNSKMKIIKFHILNLDPIDGLPKAWNDIPIGV